MGNICRSPMAMAVFAHQAKAAGWEDFFLIESAGTSAYHEGESYHRETLRVCRERGVAIEGASRPVDYQDLVSFHYIIAMDRQNHANLLNLDQRGKHAGKIHLLRQFSSPGMNDTLDVPDPYYSGNKAFDEVFDIIEDASANLLTSIRRKHGF